jgi:hypothetical protein
MNLKEGDRIQIADVAGYPLRNLFVTVKRIDHRGRDTRYFCKADNGRDGWITEAHINTKLLPLDKAIPLTEAAKSANVSLTGLRNAALNEEIWSERRGKRWYTTLAEAERYRHRRVGSPTFD